MLKITCGLLLLITLAACSTEKDYLVTIETKYGNMYAILYDETPKHKENFVKLAQDGRYDSTEFHRIIENFMVQGGDVFSKENLPQEEWYTLPAEFNKNRIHEKGSIAAARQGENINPERRSSGCQFYIVQGQVYEKDALLTDIRKLQEAFGKFVQLDRNKDLREKYMDLYERKEFDSINGLMLSKKDELESFFNLDLSSNKRANQIEAYTTVGGTPHLDDTYTVFGKVIEGLDVMEKIAAEETDPMDKPKSPVYMKVAVELINKKEITHQYGYQYPEKQ
ncbi:peptidylprolyl isomerase [Negadavirga shengliensis]|uniref:Peptidyl-prolyl cis-trans isomerase n=1 Tax=Negadavirga shengliensis TaxID=1389218 RepID=A0ABV9T353_9BACT